MKGNRKVWLRGLSLLVAGGVLLAVSAVGPAMGAAGFNKNKAKRIFYTKAQADERFVNVDELPAKTVAYGHVNFADGSLDTANSKNIAGSMRGSQGYYCVNSAVPYKNVQVTLDTTGSYTVSVSSGDPFTSCGTFPSDVAVIVGGPNDSSFYIEFIA